MKKKNSSLESAIILVSIVVFIFASSITVKTLMAEPVIEITTNLAEEHLYNNRLDEAVSEYKNMQANEEWPIYNVKVAEIYSMQGEYKKSTLILEEALRILDNNISGKNLSNEEKAKYADIINDIVFTFYMNNEYDIALYTGENYLNEGNVDQKMMRTLFAINMEKGNIDKSKEILSKYPVDRENAEDLSYFSTMNMILGNYDKGLELLKDAWYIDKNEIAIYDVVYQFGESNKEFNLALNKLIDENKEEDAYKLWRAYEYANNKDTISLSKKFISSIKEENAAGTIYNYINVQIYTYEGNEDNAKKYIKALEDEKNSSAYYLIAKNLLARGEYKEAEQYAKMSISEDRDYSGSYIIMPEILTALESKDNQAIYVREAIKRAPFNLDVIIKSGDYYAKALLNYDISKEYYSLAIALSPEDSNIYYKMAMVDISAKKIDEAIKHINKAIELKPDNSLYYRTLGTIYMNEGNYEKGIEMTREAYKLNKSDVLALSNAGCYYISIEGDVVRGYENIKEAYDGIYESLGEEYKKILTDNYNKAKGLLEQYKNGNGKEIEVPEFELFY